MVFSNSRKRFTQSILGCAIALGLAGSAFAQTNSSITGVVTDSTGAAVPGASVTLKNSATGIARTVKSDAAGRYTFSALGNGTYEIISTAPNFKTTDLKGINLDVSQVLAENVTLAVGGSTEEISVEAQAVTTDTETSSNGTTLASEAVAELPLANRQFYNLVETAPGVAPPAVNSSMSFRGGMNVNGAAETANLFMVNGTFNIDISTNQPTFRPSVDTIAEFKVITGVPDASYGRMNGGQIVIVTKQGSNKFHGSVYEYIRNGAIEARPWSPSAAVAGSKAPAFKQNTFGVTVGGPILKDKAFFFFGYEGQRIRQQITATSTVPTTWTAGTYSAATNSVVGGGCLPGTVQAYDPATGSKLTLTTGGACTGAPGAGFDITTSSLWTPNVAGSSTALGRLMTGLAYPAPNVPAITGNNPTGTCVGGTGTCLASPTNNYLFNETRAETMDEFNTRFDYKQSEKDSFYGSFNHFHDPSFEPNNSLCSSRTLPNFGCYTDQISWLFNVGENHIFNPNLLNTAVVGWNRLQQPRTQQDLTSIGTLWPGLPGQFINPPSNNLGLPNISESNSSYTTTGGQTNLPQNRWDNAFDIDDSLTYTHKSHTVKVGAQLLFIKLTEFEVSQGRGSLTFAPGSVAGNNTGVSAHYGSTGDNIGDTLLGLPYQASDTNTLSTVYNRYSSADFFVMDDWKIKPNLTLNLGIRYELDFPEGEKNGNYSSFFPALPNQLYTGNGLAQPNGVFQGGMKTLYNIDPNNFAPRVGFAWQPFHNEKTVVKGGYGIFFTEPEAFNEFLSYAIQYPTRYPKTFTTQAYNVPGGTSGSINLSNPFPNELPVPGTPYCVNGTTGCNPPVVGVGAAGGCASPCGLLPVVSGTETNPHYSTPYVSQWTLGVQRQLTKDVLAEVLYFGNKGSKIAFGCTAAINTNAHPNADTLGINYANGTPTASGAPTYTALSSPNAQAQRVYPNWGSIGYHTTGCNSEYESLQSRLQVNTRTGISVLVSYTYARAEDGLSPAQDPTPTHSFDKELANFDIRHRIVISPVVPLPFGKGQMMANSGIAAAVLGGFKVSGIYQYFTGRPFNIANSTTSLLSGGIANPSSLGGEDRPDLIVGTSINGFDATNNAPVHNHNEWFNVHSLAYAPPGTFGNLAPNTAEGPGWDELDLTLGRTFAVKEWAKAEFKFDAFNLLNHPNLYNPTNSTYAGNSVITSLAYPTTPGYCAAGAAAVVGVCTAGGGVNGAGSFGTITQANNMRELQASVHITF